MKNTLPNKVILTSSKNDSDELRNQAEAVLFAIGKPVELEALSNLISAPSQKAVIQILEQLQKDYDNRASPLMVVQDGTKWKLTVRERYLSLIKDIVADTELSKTVMETLAVIAWKNPAMQSDIIKIRTNKAYEHIHELEELGFITREKHGRTKLIKLTEKFFNYFELEGNREIRQVFSKHPTPRQETLGDLSVYDQKHPPHEVAGEETEHLGDLEVIDEPDTQQQEPNLSEHKTDSNEETSESDTPAESEATAVAEKQKNTTENQDPVGVEMSAQNTANDFDAVDLEKVDSEDDNANPAIESTPPSDSQEDSSEDFSKKEVSSENSNTELENKEEPLENDSSESKEKNLSESKEELSTDKNKNE